MSNELSRAWRRYRSLPVVQRELVTFGLWVLFAVTILPLAIWTAGHVFLGDYVRDPLDPGPASHGGPFGLILDYLRGIVSGSPAHWLVLLGPYGLLWAYRVGRRLI